MDEKEVKLEQIEVNQGFWDRIKSIIVEAIAGNVGQEEAIEEVERIEQEVVAETEAETSLSEDTAEEAVEITFQDLPWGSSVEEVVSWAKENIVSSGLAEVLISPIIAEIPAENPERRTSRNGSRGDIG